MMALDLKVKKAFYGLQYKIMMAEENMIYKSALRQIDRNERKQTKKAEREASRKESEEKNNVETVEVETFDPDPIPTMPEDGVKNEVSLIKIKDDEVEILDPVYEPVFLSDDELEENLEEAYKFIRGDGRQIKLCILSIFYMAQIIKPEQVFSRCKTTEDIEFINSVVKFYSGICVVPSCNTLSINEVVSLNLLKQVIDFESNYEILIDNDPLYEIVKKTEDLFMEMDKKNLKINGNEGVDPKVPLFFTARNMNLTANHGVSKAVVNKLEKEFGSLLSKYAYQFNNMGEMIELVIHSNGRLDSYYIDPGTIIGNGFNVICNIPGDTIMVNQKHKDILEKVFENNLYVLSSEEIQRVYQDMFQNDRIYYMVDMSKGPEFIPKLSEEEFNKLGKKLSFILNLPWDMNTIPFGRLRFRSFKSVDDFVLVSDDKCKSPLASNNDTCGFISPGLTIKVDGDNVTMKNDSYSKDFKIEEYNVQ